MKFTKIIALLLVLMMTATVICGCGAKETAVPENTDAVTEETAETEAVDDNSFLLGSWFVDSIVMDGQELTEDEFFGETFSFYFNDKNECYMNMGSNYAIVNYEVHDNGVTLTGDDTYELTFTDETKTKCTWELKGAEVTMSKYEEEE